MNYEDGVGWMKDRRSMDDYSKEGIEYGLAELRISDVCRDAFPMDLKMEACVARWGRDGA